MTRNTTTMPKTSARSTRTNSTRPNRTWPASTGSPMRTSSPASRPACGPSVEAVVFDRLTLPQVADRLGHKLSIVENNFRTAVARLHDAGVFTAEQATAFGVTIRRPQEPKRFEGEERQRYEAALRSDRPAVEIAAEFGVKPERVNANRRAIAAGTYRRLPPPKPPREPKPRPSREPKPPREPKPKPPRELKPKRSVQCSNMGNRLTKRLAAEGRTQGVPRGPGVRLVEQRGGGRVRRHQVGRAAPPRPPASCLRCPALDRRSATRRGVTAPDMTARSDRRGHEQSESLGHRREVAALAGTSPPAGPRTNSRPASTSRPRRSPRNAAGSNRWDRRPGDRALTLHR